MAKYCIKNIVKYTFIILIIFTMNVISTGEYSYGESSEEYTPKVILTIPWGTKKGEFGYHEYTEEEKRDPGPYVSVVGIAIDKDENIYIGDIQNNEILVYDKVGFFKYKIDLNKYIEVGYLDSIGIDKTQKLYVINYSYKKGATGYAIILDLNGNFIKRLPGNIDYVQTNTNGDVFFRVFEEGKDIMKKYDYGSDHLENVPFDIPHYNSKGNYYEIISSSFEESKKLRMIVHYGLREYNQNGKLIREINPEILLSGIIGVDKFDNIYGYFARREEEKKGRKMQPSIIKLDKHGKLISIILLVEPWWRHLIDKDGNIYQISGWRGEGENQFTIIKYGRKLKNK